MLFFNVHFHFGFIYDLNPADYIKFPFSYSSLLFYESHAQVNSAQNHQPFSVNVRAI